MELSGLVHAGPLHLVRVIYNCGDDKDEVLGYDGLTDQGRQCFRIQGNDEIADGFEIGIKLTTGLYISLEENGSALVVFDPLGDE